MQVAGGIPAGRGVIPRRFSPLSIRRKAPDGARPCRIFIQLQYAGFGEV